MNLRGETGDGVVGLLGFCGGLDEVEKKKLGVRVGFWEKWVEMGVKGVVLGLGFMG